MPQTAILQSCEYVNSFPSQYGDADGKLHCYRYLFDDGTEGTANHKAAPEWQQGDQLDYAIAGDHRGVNKLKVAWPGKLQVGGPPQRQSAPPRPAAAPPRTNAAPARQNAPTGQGTAYVGEAVGHAINNAVQIAMREFDGLGAGAEIGLPKFWQRAYEHASRILRMSDNLKAGKLAPKPTGDMEPPREESSRHRPAPTATGEAFDNDDDNVDVPF